MSEVSVAPPPQWVPPPAQGSERCGTCKYWAGKTVADSVAAGYCCIHAPTGGATIPVMWSHWWCDDYRSGADPVPTYVVFYRSAGNVTTSILCDSAAVATAAAASLTAAGFICTTVPKG